MGAKMYFAYVTTWGKWDKIDYIINLPQKVWQFVLLLHGQGSQALKKKET